MNNSSMYVIQFWGIAVDVHPPLPHHTYITLGISGYSGTYDVPRILLQNLTLPPCQFDLCHLLLD